MTKPKENPSEIRSAFVVSGFEKLVTDYTLDDVFYPSNERVNHGFGISSTILAGPVFHPLHPEFKMPELHITDRIGLLGMPSDSKPEQPRPNVVDIEQLQLAQQARVNNYWLRVKDHQVFRWLNSNSDFNKAWETFQRKKKTEGRKYSHPYAEFRFLKVSGFHLCMFTANNRRADPEPSADDKDSAIKHVDKVLDDICYKGLGFEQYSDQARLRELLKKLRVKIEQSKSIKAERIDKKGWKPYRDLNRRLARALLIEFDEASITLVHHLAAAVGSTLGLKAVQNHLADTYLER